MEENIENKEQELVYIGIYPFQQNIQFDKDQVNKILEEASELHNSIMNYVKYIQFYEMNDNDITEEDHKKNINMMIDDILMEAGDSLQVVINNIYLLLGNSIQDTQEAIIHAMNNVNNKNIARGYFKLKEQESEETDDNTDDGAES